MLIVPTDRERWLANHAHFFLFGVDVLYHGTRYAGAILRSGMLLPSPGATNAICLTRSPLEAAYWAMFPRDGDEGRGTVFVLQRDRLEARARLDPFRHHEGREEYEERVWSKPVELVPVMVGYVSEPFKIDDGDAPSSTRPKVVRVRKKKP
jgi:hypothetical protein